MPKIYVLDTNVLMYEPKSLFAFEDNEVVIPLVVLDELDKKKDGTNQAAKHARMAIRMLDEMRYLGSIHEGIPTENGGKIRVELNCKDYVPTDLDPNRVDNRIISVAIGLSKKGGNVKVITKDLNLRVKADALGVAAEDYTSDIVVDRLDDIYTGHTKIKTDSNTIDKLHSDGKISLEGVKLYPNQYAHMYTEDSQKNALVRYNKDNLEIISFYNNIWGLSAKNREQKYALDALFNPDIKLITISGRAGSGKAQPLDSKILTPGGWKLMGSLSIGDTISTPDGGTAKIKGIYPQGKKSIYRVIFTDGTYAECCKEHLWYTKTQKNRDRKQNGSTKSLKEIMASLRDGKYNKRNHSIPITCPVYFENRPVLIEPYIMGILLGDGSFRNSISFTNIDQQILKEIYNFTETNGLQMTKKSDNISYYITKKYINGKRQSRKVPNILLNSIRALGLFNKKSDSKFIPDIYKFNSIEKRISLLQGLLDTDGTMGKGHHITYTTISTQLANDVKELVESLGGTAKICGRFTKYTYKGVKKIGKKSYRLNICLPNNITPFRLKRKLEMVKERTKYFPRRYIDGVEYVGEKEAQCIYVDHSDHLYITDNFIVTHNTLISLLAAVSQTIDKKTYKRIVITRPVQSVGKELGFLPGSLDEKLEPWMTPIYDNLDLIFSEKGRHYVDGLKDEGQLEIEPLTYIRGRSLNNAFMIIDESQNLSRHEVKTLITRAGFGTKVILTGDVEQIDTPYLDYSDNGLSYTIEKFKDDAMSAHITLVKGERSELATLAAEKL